MTTKFNAEFIDVETIESRVVTPDGRVTGLSRHKGREVKIIVLEEPPYCTTVTYGAGIEGGVPLPSRQRDQELGTFVDAAKEIVMNEDISELDAI
jgi:hypothetical protein